MARRNSPAVPTSLRAAFEADKAHALKHKRLNVERLAELLGATPATLYKWIETDAMPCRALLAWQHITGSMHVVRYIASREGAVVVQIPPGRNVSPEDITELQTVLTAAPAALLDLKAGRTDREQCMSALTGGMESLAWHRANVERSHQPELEF